MEEFCNILGDFFLIQKNMLFICGLGIIEGNILDLVLINNEFFVRDVFVYLNVFDFDYFFFIFIFVVKFNRVKNVQRKVYCYKKVDFIGLWEILYYIFWELVIFDCFFEDCLIRF